MFMTLIKSISMPKRKFLQQYLGAIVISVSLKYCETFNCQKSNKLYFSNKLSRWPTNLLQITRLEMLLGPKASKIFTNFLEIPKQLLSNSCSAMLSNWLREILGISRRFCLKSFGRCHMNKAYKCAFLNN